MRALLIIMLSWSCGGGRRPVPKTIATPTETPQAIVPQEEASRAPGPWYTRQANWSPGNAIRAPGIHWAKKLDGPIVHPLSTDGSSIYAVAGGRVYCISKEGSLQWSSPINADGPPTLGGSGLYIPTALGVMQLLDPETGQILTSYGGQAPIHTALLVLEESIVWMDAEGTLVSPDGPSSTSVPGPIADAASDGETLVVGNAEGKVFAVADNIRWEQSLPGPAVHHPVIDKTVAFVPFSAADGQPGGVVAVNIQSGATVWTTFLKFQPGGAPALGEHLIVPDKRSELVALDVNHGGIRWRAPGPAVFSIQPAIVGRAIYAGDTGGRLRRIDSADGGTVWSIDLGAPITGEPVVIDGTVIVGTSDGRLIAVGEL